MVNAQEWLDKWYPRDGVCKIENEHCGNFGKTREDITKLIICSNSLEGSLKLEGFTNLTWFDCFNNQLNDFDFSSLNPIVLTILSVCDNNLTPQDLSCLSSLVNLEQLWIGNYIQERINQGSVNHFFGSLKPFQKLTKLKILGISGTDINSGLEYLPQSLEEFYFIPSNTKAANLEKVLVVYRKERIGQHWKYTDHAYNLREWRNANQGLITKSLKAEQLEQENQCLSQQLTLINQTLAELTSPNQKLINIQQVFLQSQLQTKEKELAELVKSTKVKLSEILQDWLDSLLESQEELFIEPDNPFYNKQLNKAQEKLLTSNKLTQEELKTILKQKSEINELKKQIKANSQNYLSFEEAEVAKTQLTNQQKKLKELAEQAKSKITTYEQSNQDAEYENHASLLQDLLDNQETLTIYQNSPNIKPRQIAAVSKQLGWAKNSLLHILTSEELSQFCQAKVEIVKLELQLEKNQQGIDQHTEQQAQIIQPTYGIPGSSKNY